MAKINAISNVTQDLTLDPGASGDSFVQFDINATGEFRIGVFDTNDSFRISQGSALGTNDTWIMTDAGERTMPLQPAFLGQLSAQDANVTGNGTSYTMGQGNAVTNIFDQGSDFTTAGVFTAPVTGCHFLTTSMLMQNSSGATDMDMRIFTSNRVWRGVKVNPSTSAAGAQFLQSYAFLCDMDAADTADSRLTLTGIGSDSADIFGSAANEGGTSFSGRLVC